MTGSSMRTMALLLLLPAQALTAEFTLTFDPPLVPGGQANVSDWGEKGMRLATASDNMYNRDDGYGTWCPSNGTAFTAFQNLDNRVPAILTNVSGLAFSTISVQLAEYAEGLFLVPHVEFTGYRLNGSIVTNVFVLDGIIDGDGPIDDFETFTFQGGFTNLSYVRIRNADALAKLSCSMDNLRVGTAVTNPALVADISATGGIVALSVANLSMMASNLVQRSNDLLQSNWVDAGWFVSSNQTAQWSEPVSNNWTNVFYRVRSR